MRKGRFGGEQIVGVQKELAAGENTGALCRRHGIGQQTLYRRKQKHDGLAGHDLRRLKALEEENARRGRLVAEQALDTQAPKELLRNNGRGPPNGGRPSPTPRHGSAPRRAGRVGSSAGGAPRFATNLGIAAMLSPCGRGSGTGPRSVLASATGACASCRGGRASSSTASGWSACTGQRGWPCAAAAGLSLDRP